MIPQIIHLTTKSGELNGDEAIILGKNKSVFAPPLKWEFKVYSDADNQRITDESFPEFKEKFNALKGVMKADVMRCLYLYLYGGIYIDTDYEFFKMPDASVLEGVCAIPLERENSKDDYILGNCIFFSEKGYQFWYDYIADVFSRSDLAEIKEEDIIDTTGPWAITRFYLAHKDKYPEIKLISRNVFLPKITHYGLGIEKKPETCGAHYCFGSWRKKTTSSGKKWFFLFVQHLQARGWNKF